MMRMHLEFVKYLPSKPEPISYPNSGQENFDNLSLIDLEERIDKIIEDFHQLLCNSNDITRKVIVYYDKYTYFAIKDMPFPSNLSNPEEIIGISEQSIRRFLKEFDNRYKSPISNLLKHYYRIKFNPELEFEGNLLEKLGFKKCGVCS